MRAGESIYLRGVLPDGAMLEGDRLGRGLDARGAQAACVSCHQRSGLGESEDSIEIPPIAARYLFTAGETGGDAPDLPYVAGMRTDRPPYTVETFARAVRDGIDSAGKPLGYLMPRFRLDDAQIGDLVGYLRTLAPAQVPGVTALTLHFATIITPDADPVKGRGMLDVLDHFFAEKNNFPFAPSPLLRARGRGTYGKSMYRANRRWKLHVWRLTGPASQWRAELERDMASDPVMAVISGLGRDDWTPVHDFCEQDHVPCLFPNVDVPVARPGDFYSLYYSGGVLLEAGLIAKSIETTATAHKPRSVLQIYRAGDSGAAAAAALAADLRRHGWRVDVRMLPAGAPGRGLEAALRGARAAGALVLWLRPADIAALGDAAAAPATVYMSGLMGGLEHAPLPAGWRGRTLLAYPFDLPQRRMVRVDFPMGWFSFLHIPVVAEAVQVNTYLACGMLAETLNGMADNFDRELLVEQMEDMLEHRYLTGYYPRLDLAPGQSFASKGGYLVKFAAPRGSSLLADGAWTVP
ncbi:MAG: cytochrome c [Gammaproteobacteria bacterium]|nr:cytochrome c [Gammaproteobacteria bacterium]